MKNTHICPECGSADIVRCRAVGVPGDVKRLARILGSAPGRLNRKVRRKEFPPEIIWN